VDLVRAPESETIRRLGILSGSFNPPTVAHVELARAALDRVDAVLLVVPRVFPHAKDFTDASLDQRIEMLQKLDSRFGIAIADRGLFIEIARETREIFNETDLWFLCGADAASRIVNWDYGAPRAFHSMLEEFGLLVARRGEVYEPPPDMAQRIEMLPIDNLDEVSSTEVRDRIRAEKDWQELVPAELHQTIKQIYR
jgi:nicotinate (nicotinamide) nucleotide adenylyltransferase